MRLGGTVCCSEPDQWENRLTASGFRAITAPFTCETPRDEVERLLEISGRHDVRIAEVGVWRNPFDPVHGKENLEYAKKQLEIEIYDGKYDINMIKRNGKKEWIRTLKLKDASKVYGYCRISRREQKIERQIRNIQIEYPDAFIVQEAFTGTKMDRPEWKKLYDKVRSGDTIVFDSVSRMSRNADEGVDTYFTLFEKGVHLVFLKEKYINTDTYQENLKDKIELQGTDEDEIFKGLNNYFRKLAERQIRIAFEQAEKEVEDLHQRTREGIETARKIAGLFSPDAVPYEMIQSLSSLDDSVTDAVRLRNYASILKEESGSPSS